MLHPCNTRHKWVLTNQSPIPVTAFNKKLARRRNRMGPVNAAGVRVVSMLKHQAITNALALDFRDVEVHLNC